MLRTADGFGIRRVFLTGYTPYPASKKDPRLPHLRNRIDRQINKTALGAEMAVAWVYRQDVSEVIDDLKSSGYMVMALEQTKRAQNLNDFKPSGKTALIVGSEINGLEKSILEHVTLHLQIPMLGKKESFNVAVAAAIALYHLRYR
jgi:tRNA G18 (ribose-2'-O)-methylase SpoU